MSVDVAVIGSGPAGALAAFGCASRGASVLLVDRSRFPRDKVCGCCLNGQAVAGLETAGLGGVLDGLRARRVDRITLACSTARASLPIGAMRVVARSALDAALARRAVDAGALFRESTTALVGRDTRDGVEVTLRTPGMATETIRPRCVLVADGLSGSSLRERPGFDVRVRRASRFGVATNVPAGGVPALAGGLLMVCGAAGYVGLVELEDGTTNLAAALDQDAARAAGGPGEAVAMILAEAGVDHGGLGEAPWRGAPALTRSRPRLESGRVLVIGDAAGYVEPFTGEGMAWALSSAAGVVPFALARCSGTWSGAGGEWTRAQRRAMRSGRRGCRGLASLLRRPRLTRLAVRALAEYPGLAAPLTRRLGRARPADRSDGSTGTRLKMEVT